MLDIIINLTYIQRNNIEANPLVVVLDSLDKSPIFFALVKAEGLSSDFITLSVFMNLYIGRVKVRDILIFENHVIPYCRREILLTTLLLNHHSIAIHVDPVM